MRSSGGGAVVGLPVGVEVPFDQSFGFAVGNKAGFGCSSLLPDLASVSAFSFHEKRTTKTKKKFPERPQCAVE